MSPFIFLVLNRAPQSGFACAQPSGLIVRGGCQLQYWFMRFMAEQFLHWPELWAFFVAHLLQLHSPFSPLIWSWGMAPPPMPVGRVVDVRTPAMMPCPAIGVPELWQAPRPPRWAPRSHGRGGRAGSARGRERRST